MTSLTGSAADAVLEYQQVVVLWEKLLASEPHNRAYTENLARTLNQLGAALVVLKVNDQALQTFGRARGLLEPLAGSGQYASVPRRELALTLRQIASLENDNGQFAKALTSIQQALAIESQRLADDPHVLESQISAAKTYSILAQIMLGQPDGWELASAAYLKTIDILQAVTQHRPELASQSYEMALCLGNLSSCQRMEGKLDSALASAQKALTIFERLNRQTPDLFTYQQGLGSAYNMMSDLHRLRREPTDSLTFAQKARTLLERMVSEHSQDESCRADLAKSHNNIGRIFQQMGDSIEALRSYRRAVDLYETISNLDPRNNYNLASNLSLCIPLIGTKNGSQGSLDTLNLSKRDLRRRQIYSDRAIELLRTAVRGGFRNDEILRSDTDLDAIRDRAEFQSLLKDVEADSPPSRK
jgi:tetratricopeptide (TPR) repeat protein